MRVIIDTDPGIGELSALTHRSLREAPPWCRSSHMWVRDADDAMAILAAFNSPDVQVVGLTSIYGKVPTRMATSNAVFLRELAGRPDVSPPPGQCARLVGSRSARSASAWSSAAGRR